jgi:hypothetical protein
MKRSKEKVIVKWSKKENDWQSKWPEWENRNAKITGHAFFDMIRKWEEFMSKDWEGKPTGFTNLRDYLSNGGFDPDTFTISVNAKIKEENKTV